MVDPDTAPEGWPPGASWRRHAPLWEAALRRASSYERHPDPCKGADHWGAPYGRDIRRAMRAIEAGRWTHAVCDGETANNFYVSVKGKS